MKKRMIVFSGLLLFGSVWMKADENETAKDKENTFSMSAQIRPRAEYRNGASNPREEGQTPTGFISNRARLSMNYERDRLSLGLSAQHVGVWGQDPQIDKNGRFILNEAWAQLDFGHGIFAKLGRQSLIYDDERILGGLDWNVAGRYHDALKLGYENSQNKLHLILAFNQNNDNRNAGGTYYNPGAQPYKNMQTLWYKHVCSKVFNASFMFMNLGLEAGDPETQKSDTKYMQLLGTNLYYAPGDWTFGGTFYYEFGKNMANRDVSAFLWALNAAYKINSQWSIALGSDYLSGANNTDGPDAKYKAFDPLYGTHHKFYGAMDYYYATPFKTGFNPGLWDNQVKLAYNVSSKVNLSLAYHYFSITSDLVIDNKELGRGLGSEVDLQVDWQIMKDVKLSTGYSTMFGTSTMEIVKGGSKGSWQDWGWLSLNINPRIFMAKW